MAFRGIFADYSYPVLMLPRIYILASFTLLSYCLSGCMTIHYRSRISPKQLGLNQIQLWRLKKFVGQQNNDRCEYDKRYNIVAAYGFSPEATSAKYVGLISVHQRNRSHGSTMYFINGKHRITPLDLKLVRCGPADYVTSIDTTAEKIRRHQIVEAALQRHSELPDSLKQHIRNHLHFLW